MKDKHSLVIQSAVLSAEPEWIRMCASSVRQWAGQQGYSYRLYGDELFDVLSDMLASKLDGSPVVASDLPGYSCAGMALSRRTVSDVKSG